MKAYPFLISLSILFILQTETVRIGTIFCDEETDLNDATVHNKTHW